MITKRFLVALSFPGEHRNYVHQVANALAEKLGQDKVFYDQWYTAELAQPDMDVLLQSFYHDHSELIVPFLCADYERKEWCGLEWRAIRDLIKRRQSKDIMPMRFDNTEIPGIFSIDGYVDLNGLAPQRTAELILERLGLNQVAISKPAIKIYSNYLPTVEGEFFGRDVELKLLDQAWAGNVTDIIQFIAPGGTGKTKLLRHWLDRTKDIDALIAWSFYSQGSSEDKQVSASPFFSHVFDKLGSTRSFSSFATEEEKGEHLADLLRQQRGVLVLDGLEPLQHAGKGMRGELKDRAIRQLLRSLAGQNNGLCIITTRIAVHELSDRTHAITHDLQNLTSADGVQLLKSLKVQGSDAELEKAVKEYGCHALALHLLGNALHTYLDDDVRKRDTLAELIGDSDDLERHAFKVMQAYSYWLDGTPELKLLQLLGLFDHPIETEVLQVLWQAQIPDLTANIDEKSWKVAIRDLREKHRLLSMHENRTDLLDCHPLIREYFGKQLREKQPDAWRQANTRLCEYYKALPEKELPDTLEEMQPLFHAVAHGCAAGLHQQVLEDVYWPRIKRKGDHYLTKKLSAFSDDLAVVAHFFVTPWSKVVDSLDDIGTFGVLGWTGANLHALARLRESLESTCMAHDLAFEKQKWDGCAKSAITISEQLLALGELNNALVFSQKGIDFANQCNNPDNQKLFLQVVAHAQHARVLHLRGASFQAVDFFNRAMQFQQKRQPIDPAIK
ncbi:TIR domain-containing protein [Nitrosomonas sp. sh817]|nr:TIR domain-containing protein [Nitrosomonas sp. sh817]